MFLSRVLQSMTLHLKKALHITVLILHHHHQQIIKKVILVNTDIAIIIVKAYQKIIIFAANADLKEQKHWVY